MIVKIGPFVSAQLTLYSTPKILCFTMLFNRQTARKVPLPEEASTCSLDPLDSAFQTASRSVQPFLHSSWQVPIPYNVR